MWELTNHSRVPQHCNTCRSRLQIRLMDSAWVVLPEQWTSSVWTFVYLWTFETHTHKTLCAKVSDQMPLSQGHSTALLCIPFLLFLGWGLVEKKREIHHLGNQRSSCVMSQSRGVVFCLYSVLQKGRRRYMWGEGCLCQSINVRVCVCVLCVSAVKKRGEGMSSQAAVAANSNPPRSSIWSSTSFCKHHKFPPLLPDESVCLYFMWRMCQCNNWPCIMLCKDWNECVVVSGHLVSLRPPLFNSQRRYLAPVKQQLQVKPF